MHIENNDTQDLINRVCSDPVGCFTSGFDNLLSSANLIISSISLLMIIMTSTLLGGIVIVAASVPLFFAAMKLGRRNYEMSKEAKKIQRRYGYLASVLTDREYAQERTLFEYSSNLQKKYDVLYSQSCKIESKIEKKTYTYMKSGSIITLIIIAVIVAILIPSLGSGRMSIGIVIALVNAILSLVQSMSWQLAETMREHSRLQEYLKDFNVFLNLSEKRDACTMPKYVDEFMFETLEFQNVSFQYPGTQDFVLKNCSFTLHNGKSYSIVGINGAGKSTIIKLIVGMYDNYEGTIFLNGKNIREYDFAAIKALISVVFQDFNRYAVTLKENIMLGDNRNCDESRIRKVTAQMGLAELYDVSGKEMERPLGKIRENGMDASGGQWQRIAIARLLYSSSKINILDEPVAALDPAAESKVYELFRSLNKDKFTIYITHRLGAAKIADEILVVANGQMEEAGSHAQLMSLEHGLYRSMFESQSSWYQ